MMSLENGIALLRAPGKAVIGQRTLLAFQSSGRKTGRLLLVWLPRPRSCRRV